MKTRPMLQNESALQRGDVFPDFSLPDSTRAAVCSAELLARGPMVVFFYRERVVLNALSLALPEVKESGGALVAVSLGMLKEAPTTLTKFDSNFYLVSDPDNALARKAGLIYRPTLAWQAEAVKVMLPFVATCGSGSWQFRLPATYTVGQDRIIQDVFFDTDSRPLVTHTRSIAEILRS
jgi:peroxiredoxin